MVHKLRYKGDDIELDVGDDAPTVLDLSLTHKIPHIWECGGKGKCTTCRVRVLEGLSNVSPPTRVETMLAKSRGWDEYTRLACQMRVKGDAVVERLVRNSGESSRLLAEELQIELGREVQMAILFCDLRDFTPISESHLPYDVVHILNRYFERIGEAVIYNSGFINQYAGDELVAWFGLHGGTPETNCLNAVRAGLGMMAILDEVNKGLEADFGLTLRMTVGIHYGSVVLGHIGHSSHKQLSAVGDAMNTAARIETINRETGTYFLISEQVHKHLSGRVAVGQEFDAALKGKRGTHKLLEVKGFADTDPLLLVQNTFERILGNPDGFGHKFYDRLFTLHPDVRAMFKGDLNSQVRMFMEMLRYVLHGINRFEEIGPGLKESGRRHKKAYGVEERHYHTVMQVFQEVLREELPAEVGPEVIEAWESVMGRITGAMSAGAR